MTPPIKLIFTSAVGQIRVLADDTLRYVYRANMGVLCEDAMLCCVSEPWRKGFADLIAQHGMDIDSDATLDVEPFCADRLDGYYNERGEHVNLRQQRHDRAPWVICPTCRGDGKHSRNLGAYTQEEFDEQFSPEEQEDYFNGVYDTTCNTCHGTGKVRDVQESYTRHQDQLNWERGVNDAGEPLC